MNRKQLVTLLVLAALIGGAGLVVHSRRQTSWSGGDAAAGKKLLGDFPVNDVTQIALKEGTSEVTLVKQDDLWRVRERGDYPANFSRIGEFLLKARDLKIVQSEKVGVSQLPRLRLAPGQGTNSPVTVEFRGRDGKSIQTLLLGKPHLTKPGRSAQPGEDEGWPDGRYVKTGSSEDVALISDPLDMVQTKPEEWLDKDFIKVDKAKTIEVAYPAATNSWKLTRDTESAEWTLAGAKADEKPDAGKIAGVSNPLSSPAFADVLPADKLAGAGANPPAVVKIETFDHFDYTVRVGGKTNEDYPVTVAVTAEIPKERAPGKDEKPEDKARLDKEFKDRREKLEDKLKREQGFGRWTYLVQSWSLDPLLKERAQFLAGTKVEPKKEGETSADTGGKSDPQPETPAPAAESKE